MRANSLLSGRNHGLPAYARILLTAAFIALPLLAASSDSRLSAPPTARAQSETQVSDPDMFGMVIRDPFYEYNTDPVDFPNATNKTALERQAIELHAAGVQWVRLEFFADYDGSVARGDINWAKYDYFINTLAPKYNLKVLALLNVGMVAYDGSTVRTLAFNDPPDGGGTDPNDGSNHFIRVLTGRAQEIAARYGTAISAYEIINEPNISFDLWVDSHSGSAEIKPERYSALIANAYHAIKAVNPQCQVIVGGLLIGKPPEGQDHDQFDYLYQLYVSHWVDQYRAAGYGSRPGWNTVPWDGVAVHPYFLDPPQLFAILKDFARKLQDRGDSQSKLWITEIGAQAAPPASPLDPPTADEIKQADYLRAVYSGILNDPELHNAVAHTFWFKYEDFVPGSYTSNYGVVRLEENAAHDNYAPSGKVWVHKLAYEVYQELAHGYAITDPVDPSQVQPGSTSYFSATGQEIAPEFVNYWTNNGGLGRFGYPISRPVVLGGYLSQFFERAVFEYHPEYAGTPSEVLLRLLGNEYTQGMTFDKVYASTIPTGTLYFPQTGHTLGGTFLNYWQGNGGLAVYGYPISEQVSEVSPTDGLDYTVQYFERNRFELHPEAAGTPFEVQLGLLGANMLKQNLWWR